MNENRNPGNNTPVKEGRPVEGRRPAPEGRPVEGRRPGAEGRAVEGRRSVSEGRPDESRRPVSEGRTVEGRRPVSDGKPVEGRRPAPEGRPAEGRRSTPEGRPIEGRRPAEGRPVEGRRPVAEGRPAEGRRPAPEGRSVSEGRPDESRRPTEGRRPAPEGRPVDGRRPGAEGRPNEGRRSEVEGRPVEGRPVEGRRPAPEDRAAEGRRPTPDGKPSEGRPNEGRRSEVEGRPVEGRPVEGRRPAEGRPDEGRRPAPEGRSVPEGRPVEERRPAPEGRPAEGRRPAPESKPVEGKKPASEEDAVKNNTSAAEGTPEHETKPEGTPDRESKAKPEGTRDSESEAKPEGTPDPDSETKPEGSSDPESDAESESRPVKRKRPSAEGSHDPAPDDETDGTGKSEKAGRSANRPQSSSEKGPVKEKPSKEYASGERAANGDGTKVKSTHNNRVRNVHEMEREYSEEPPIDEKSVDSGKKKKRSKKKRALRIYFIYLAVLIILSTIVLAVLWFKLADYQKGLDEKERLQAAAPTATPTPSAEDNKKAAQEAFEKYADGLSVQDWTTFWMKAREADPEDESTVTQYFTDALQKGDISYYLDLSYDEAAPVYKIKLGDKDAARVSMLKDPVGKWSMGALELLLKGDYSVEDELPSGMGLLVNGVPVTPTEDTVDHFPYKSIEDVLVNPVVWQKYDIQGMLADPELSYDNEDSFIWSEDDGCYLAMAADIPDEVSERAEKFFYAYMNYTMSGGAGWKDYKAAKEAADAAGQPAPGNPVLGRLGGCIQYTPTDSVAYSMLQKAFDSTCYGLAYSNHEYGLMEKRGPIRWADNCVGVDFFYHAYATLNGQRKDYSGGDQLFRVYFINVDGSWKIWAFTA